VVAFVDEPAVRAAGEHAKSGRLARGAETVAIRSAAMVAKGDRGGAGVVDVIRLTLAVAIHLVALPAEERGIGAAAIEVAETVAVGLEAFLADGECALARPVEVDDLADAGAVRLEALRADGNPTIVSVGGIDLAAAVAVRLEAMVAEDEIASHRNIMPCSTGFRRCISEPTP
jgi:hypothetical protein